MNITFISNVTNFNNAYQHLPQLKEHDVAFFPLSANPKDICTRRQTEILMADAMATVGSKMIDAMPQLKLIQSEGVGYQGIDLTAARQRGIYVCNNKGVNDTAVAEDTVLLILGCLKSIITGHNAVYEGRQIQVKRASFGVVRELSQCMVGFIGFGDIARAAAKMLGVFGCKLLYSNRTRYPELEAEYGIKYVSREKLLAQSDFVSLHLAVTEDTKGIVNESFLEQMKPDAFLINTARGDLVDNQALHSALLNGRIAGAGLDVISPEPVLADNILLDEKIRDKMVLTPHIAGITALTVEKIYRKIWENIQHIVKGEKPVNIVNGVL